MEENKLKYVDPKVIKEFKKNWLICSIWYLLEDRLPHLDIHQAMDQKTSKYKHYIRFRVFFTEYGFSLGTSLSYNHLPFINGKVTEVPGSHLWR